jgi:hypothetical protein
MTRKFTQGKNADRFNQIIDDIADVKGRAVYDRRTAKTGHWIHRATVAADAGGGSTIACTLPNYIDSDGELESLTVECDISGGSALNEASPRLSIGSKLAIWNDSGTWRAIMMFQATEDCDEE